MDARLRRGLETLTRGDVPTSSGVYALYRDGEAQYVGKASSLLTRFWGKHMGRGVSMTGSALRRNVAELLGIASAGDIKARRYLPTADDAARVVAWIRACEVAWVETPTPAEALDLEDAMKAEKLPPLTKR
jgi:excinuclease UvrABC nuclease subunit